MNKEELEDWWSDSSVPLLPIAKRIFSGTIAGGGWVKSKKQQLKENRINKLRKLEGKNPNVVLEKDEYIEGLVSVQPLSAPIGNLIYIDYKYGNHNI